jgi:putative hydrolase of the HAD superfamily
MDLKLGLISNTGFTSPEMYNRWFTDVGLLHYFDHMAFSNGVAAAKPSAHIFKPVLEALGVEAGHTLHVGDNLHTDIAGAASLGMRTAWISGVDASEPVVAPDYTVRHVSEIAEIAGR